MNQKGWLPYRLKTIEKKRQLYWLYFGNKPFDDPFFDETISRSFSFPENLSKAAFTTSTDEVTAVATALNSVHPACIIFHTSRCGSTILSQLLTSDPNNTVLAEVPLFDEILRFPFRHPDIDFNADECLEATIALYGNHHNPPSKRLFIKVDSWHLHFYTTYRKIYPETPFVLLYRHPFEIISSHQKRRGMQSVPNLLEPGLLGLDHNEIATTNLDEYMALVLCGYYRQMIQILETDQLAIAFNYKEDILSIIEKIYQIQKTNLSRQLKHSFINRLTYHGKYPDTIFTKQYFSGAIPPYLYKALDLYHELEVIKTANTFSQW